MYSDRKENGELEAHISTGSGTGSGMRIFMKPGTGICRLMVGKSRIKLYPVLKGLGLDDQEIEKHEDSQILATNQKAEDSTSFQKFMRHRAWPGCHRTGRG